MKENIKEFLIKSFIKKNNRTPKQAEIKFMYSEILESNGLIEGEGLLASERMTQKD